MHYLKAEKSNKINENKCNFFKLTTYTNNKPLKTTKHEKSNLNPIN